MLLQQLNVYSRSNHSPCTAHSRSKRKVYTSFSNEQRAVIGRYAAEHSSVVHNFYQYLPCSTLLIFVSLIYSCVWFASDLDQKHKNKSRIKFAEPQNWPKRIILYSHKFLALRYFTFILTVYTRYPIHVSADPFQYCACSVHAKKIFRKTVTPCIIYIESHR